MSMTLRLPPDLDRLLSSYCLATGTNRTALIRIALERHISDALAADATLAKRVESVIEGMK